MESKLLVRLLSQQTELRDMTPFAARTVMALRYAIICRKTGHDPLPELARRWGHSQAAQRFYGVMEAIGHMWPEPFAVAPPCCARASFDEALLASLVDAAALGQRSSFDQLCAEMLNGDERDMLFASMQNFAQGAPPSFW